MSPELFAEFAERFPKYEFVIYRNRGQAFTEFPDGVECLIAIPRAKIAEVIEKGGQPPYWRHGEIIEVKPASAADATAP